MNKTKNSSCKDKQNQQIIFQTEKIKGKIQIPKTREDIATSVTKHEGF